MAATPSIGDSVSGRVVRVENDGRVAIDLGTQAGGRSVLSAAPSTSTVGSDVTGIVTAVTATTIIVALPV